jgi:adenylate cyclase
VDKRRKRLRTRLFLGVAFGMTGLTLIAYAFHFGFFEGLEQQSVDMRFSLRGAQSPPKNLAVVNVDDATFSSLAVRWPFNRTLHAKVIDRICAGHPAAIAMDIQFSEYATIREDNALGQAIYDCKGKVALATTEVSPTKPGEPNLIFDPAALKQFRAKAGDSNFSTDKADVIRKMPYEIQGLKSFAIGAAEIATGKTITKSDMGESSQWIDFVGPPKTVKTYSYANVLPMRVVRRPLKTGDPKPWKVVAFGGARIVWVAQAATEREARLLMQRQQVPSSAFRDRVVVVGASAPSLQDIHPTSFGSNMAGPEIQANAIETAIEGFPLHSIGTVWDVVLIICMGFVVPLASLRTRPMVAVATGLLFAGIFIPGVLILAFNQGKVASFVYPLSALILATVGSLAVHYVVTAFEKERVRDVFSRFVPETVVDQVLEQSGEDLRIGGREVVGTVMFSDLRGFTSSAEFMPADKVIQVLNHYLHEMSEAILAHGGTLLCYMGDGIYALFGAPIDQDDHADRALAASREMLTERLPAFNQFMQELDLGTGYFMGVGLNSGPVMTGNVGHERRMDYTAVGDVVNTASRIEGMTKETPYSVLIAESTIDSLRNPPEDIVFHEEQSVRGRKEKLKLYALDIKKPDTAPGTTVAAAKPAEWKTGEPSPDAPPTPALG